MWPRTSWPLSNLTRNIVLGRASVISPSISIFSSFAIGAGQGSACAAVAPGSATRSAALERGVARALLEKAPDCVLQVLGGEEDGELIARGSVRFLEASGTVGADELHRVWFGRSVCTSKSE